MNETMRAYVVSQDGEEVKGEVTSLATDQLPAGEVTVEVEYSSLNYKDGLACIPKGGIVRTYPHIPGIDAAGCVVESQDASFAVGDRVLITGYDLGVSHWGGYAEYVRVPAAWVVKTPDNLSHFEAMALGTAGFTAAMCLLAMERNGSAPDQGPVLVTGATGGVGSVAVNILAQKGYTVAASTGKADQHDYLRDLGASEILSREDGNIYWDTELGRGRPGWHIECSAMSMKYLGSHFDIHTGGEDNIFPHHENEIAQSEAATGERFVNYWLHCRHLLVDNQKMSKSLGNFYTLRDLLDRGYKPKGLRYALLSTHYRQPMNFTLEGINGAENAVQRLLDFMNALQSADGGGAHGDGKVDVSALLQETRSRFEDSLDDDLNIAGALGAIFEMVREVNRAIAEGQLSRAAAGQVTALMHRFDTVLGILAQDAAVDERAEALLLERQEARQQRDFARADAIRDELLQMGYAVEDSPQGSRLKRV